MTSEGLHQFPADRAHGGLGQQRVHPVALLHYPRVAGVSARKARPKRPEGDKLRASSSGNYLARFFCAMRVLLVITCELPLVGALREVFVSAGFVHNMHLLGVDSTGPPGRGVCLEYCFCLGEENIVLIYFLSCCSTGRCPLSQCVMLSVPNSQPKWPQEVISLGEVVGTLPADAAGRLGLREGIPVAQGGADAFVGMGESTGISQQSGRRAPFVFQGPCHSFVIWRVAPCLFDGRVLITTIMMKAENAKTCFLFWRAPRSGRV